ncbi:MAG: VOC family protein [Chloroflexi bacterium]|nr:VOC family protein [Chloroflexota bacterium]MCY4246635.1 VOC family protein [Chloroflexota bacterium]
MFTRLAHVCIGATDLAASERFYVDQLGMEKAFDFIRAGQRIGFYVKAGETTFIEVFAESAAPNDERPAIKHFCLEVADIEQTITALTARGITVEPKKMGADNNWQAWLTDPSGLRIELMQYSENSAQFTGKPVILD